MHYCISLFSKMNLSSFFRLKRQKTCPNNGTRQEPCKLCRSSTYRNAGKTSYSRIKIDILTLKVQGELRIAKLYMPQVEKM